MRKLGKFPKANRIKEKKHKAKTCVLCIGTKEKDRLAKSKTRVSTLNKTNLGQKETKLSLEVILDYLRKQIQSSVQEAITIYILKIFTN